MKKLLFLILLASASFTQAKAPAALTTLQRVIILEGKQTITEKHFAQTDSVIVNLVNLYAEQLRSNQQVISSQYAQIKEAKTAISDLRASIKDSIEKYQSIVYIQGKLLKNGDTILIR